MITKILIAEDDDINYLLFKNMITQENIQLIRARNGQEAVDLFKKNQDVSIILMDIRMPIKDGHDAAREIKEINRSVPIIAVSAFQKSINYEPYFNAYVEKPIYQKNLLAVIDEHVKIFTNIIKKPVIKEEKLFTAEKESLNVLTGVLNILELSDYVNKSQSDNLLKKLDEIKSTIKKKTEEK